MGAARGCFVNLTKLTHGTVLRFFIGKMDQETGVFWSKTELLGQFCVFFKQLNTITNSFIRLLFLWLLGLNKLLLYKSNALCFTETTLKNTFVEFV